ARGLTAGARAASKDVIPQCRPGCRRQTAILPGARCAFTASAKLSAKTRVVVQKEFAGQLRPVQPARRLRKTRGSEVEKRQGREERKVVHAGVKRAHEPGGCVQIPKCSQRVISG